MRLKKLAVAVRAAATVRPLGATDTAAADEFSYAGANGASGQLWSGGIRQGEGWVGVTDNDRAGSHDWRHS
ncbi:hypothetical protein [Alloactinosynnema sp. L-07]|uniref:hypothetical protein n=1 Tax=Alloactinosynnema sp. L-07 TaxID=1653480 RepID=UPI0006B4B16A|nr:hypothetical protein [Alloactinosynnema sp. L-07]